MFLKRLIIILAAALIALTMSSCFLLPKEAEIPELPLVTPYDGSDFRTSTVIRGDMELTRKITCTYQATQEMKYSFSVTGELFGDIYVDVGDRVTSGTLLAEMDVKDINEQLESCMYSVKTLEIQLDEAKTAYELALRSEALAGNVSTVSSDARAASVTYIEASLRIQRTKLAELREQKKQLSLFADIDGMVTYTKTISEGSTTIKGEKVVTVTDDSTSVFVADTDSYKSFPEGLEVDILSEGVTYKCLATSPEALGISPNVRQQDSESRKVYFVIQGAETPNASNARGEIILKSESRKNVLMVSSSSVFELDGKSMVYLQEKDGSMTVKEVETGLKTTRYTEIVSGLNEGDIVIFS